MTPAPRRAHRHEQRLLLLALLGGAAGAWSTALALLWAGDHSAKAAVDAAWRWCWWPGWALASAAARARRLRPLQTVANLLAALREGDFSIRGRGARRPTTPWARRCSRSTPWPRRCATQRLGALEATRAAAQGDGGDRRGGLRLRRASSGCGWSTAPASGCSGSPRGALLGRAGRGAGARRSCSAASRRRDARARLPGRRRARGSCGAAPSARAGCRTSWWCWPTCQRALREEERQAWQRLVRVLGHEINNSLAPIQSIAGNLQAHPERGAAARATGTRTCAAAWR